MSDLISRQAAIDALNDIASELHERGRLDEEYIASWCAEEVEQLPPIQPTEPKRIKGKWVGADAQCGIACSVCGVAVDDFCHSADYIDLDYEPNFCPNCGADGGDGMSDLIDRQAAIDAVINADYKDCGVLVERRCRKFEEALRSLPSAQSEIIRCKDCKFGEQDEVGRWFCRSLGCQIGNEDGSGFCADAERRTDEE